MRGYNRHLDIIHNYRIIPKKAAGSFLTIIIIIEAFISASFVANMSIIHLYILGIGLLAIYSSAILINLIKVNSVDCGCGGVLGSKQITWATILRNGFLILIFVGLYIYETNSSSLLVNIGLSIHHVMLIICLYIIVLTTENVAFMFKKLKD